MRRHVLISWRYNTPPDRVAMAREALSLLLVALYLADDRGVLCESA